VGGNFNRRNKMSNDTQEQRQARWIKQFNSSQDTQHGIANLIVLADAERDEAVKAEMERCVEAALDWWDKNVSRHNSSCKGLELAIRHREPDYPFGLNARGEQCRCWKLDEDTFFEPSPFPIRW